MNKDNKIKVFRYRTTPYTVNYPTPTGVQSYRFTGSKKNKEEWKMIPSEVVNWLQLSTNCFRNGELVVDKGSLKEDSEVYIDEVEMEEYEKNTHTREEVVALLEGNFMKMKSALKDVTSDSEKRFVIDVAKEIKLDSNGKRKFLAEWMEIEQDLLFAEDEE